MRAHQHRALAPAPLPALGLARLEADPLKHPGHAPGHVARRLAEARGQGPSATMGPIPGRTSAMAASRCALNSPSRDAREESSISDPGEASEAAAKAPSSSCDRATIDTRSRATPSVRRSRAAEAAEAGSSNNANNNACAMIVSPYSLM